MANTDKTKAELYREERKARLAKAAKKKNKKKMSAAGKAVVAVLVAVVIALGVCSYSFVSLGVSRQMKDVYSVSDIDNVSLAEYSYYYNQVFSYYFNMAYQYEQYYGSYYGEGAGAYFMGGYEYTESPEEQKLSESNADYEDVVAAGYEEPTWADYFDYVAKQQIKNMKVLNAMAEEAGYKLDKDGQKEVDEAFKDISQAAGKSMISTNKYLSIYYGKGVTKSLVKKVLKEQTIAQNYQEILLEKYRGELTDEEITKNYEENKSLYETAGIAYYTVSAETVTTKDENGEETESVTTKTMQEAKEKADTLAKAGSFEELNAAVEKLDDELQTMDGITADSVSQYLGDEAAEWLFGGKVKVGDIKVIEQDKTGYLICCVTSLPTRDDTKMVTIRQIAIEIPEEEEDDEYIDEAEDVEDIEDEDAEDVEDVEDTEDIEETDDEEDEEAAKEAEEEAAKAAEEAKKEAEEAAAALQKENEETPSLDEFADAPVSIDIDEQLTDSDAYLKAEIILRKYLAGERTEDAFKDLADKQAEADPESEEYTDDSLVEQIYPASGSVDEEVEEWALDPSRQAGDVGIVECDGAYYIVYFVNTLDESNWEKNVKDELGNERIVNEIEANETTVLDSEAIQGVIDTTMEFAKKQISAVLANSSSSLSY